MCTVLLPPGVNPIAVNKCIISYVFFTLYGSVGHASHFDSGRLITAYRRTPGLKLRVRISLYFVAVSVYIVFLESRGQ